MYLPHQMRVIDESKELVERLGKLLSFLESPTFHMLSEAEQYRLQAQAQYMAGYSAVLTARIGAFTTIH